MTADTPLVSIESLHVHFPIGAQTVRAVDGVSFDIRRGETLGLVGESGCGKSTTGRALLHLVPATSGRVLFDSMDVLAMPEGGNALRTLRQRMQVVFQDPFASLSPRLTIGQIVSEPLEIHRRFNTRSERQERVAELVRSVGLPVDSTSRFPHEFSGGQRQRIGIARALALDPEFVVLDEPVSALDISVRAQVVNLLSELQRDRGLAYLFVGHDLSLIRHVSDRVAVMYLGRIVEIATAADLYENPRHPYTRSLFEAAPVADPGRRRYRAPLEGDPPSPLAIPTGCRFEARCGYAEDICRREDPGLISVGDADHRSACHFAMSLPVWNSAQANTTSTPHEQHL